MSTTTDSFVQIGFPAPRPDPAPGCGVCRALVKQRDEAEARSDKSGVIDCNVELRNHPHGSPE
jgi:hypothetical protein